MAWIGVVTDAGRALLDSYAEGGHTLNLVGASVGSGTVHEANLRGQTALATEKDSASIIGAKAFTGGTKYKVQVGPASASVGTYVAHQIGLWAKLDNGSSTLLLLIQDSETGVSIPLASVSPNFAFGMYAALSVDNTGSLTVNIDESAYVTNGTLIEGLAGKVDTGAIADETVNTITEQSSEYPALAAGDKLSVIVGKVKKWLSDLLSKKLDKSGGTMTGDIDMGQSGATSGAKRILWTTTDGTLFYIRPYNNLFQIVRQDSNGSYNVLGFNSDGSVTMDTPANWRSALSVYSKAESDALVSTRMWSVRGNIVRSIGGTTVGYGKAMVYIVGKTVVVEFEAKITTAGTVSNLFDVGIEVAVLRSLNASIPEFTVINGGIIHYYKSDGTLDTTMEGYAGEASLYTEDNRWGFARLYNTSGSVGAWADNNFTVGKIITGTVYGTL